MEKLERELEKAEKELKAYQLGKEEEREKEEQRTRRKAKKWERERHWEMMRWIVSYIEENKLVWEEWEKIRQEAETQEETELGRAVRSKEKERIEEERKETEEDRKMRRIAEATRPTGG